MTNYILAATLFYILRRTYSLALENRKLTKAYARKHLMFKLATEEFNIALRKLTTAERDELLEEFRRNEEFLNLVGDLEWEIDGR